jgi:hypothetical protein
MTGTRASTRLRAVPFELGEAASSRGTDTTHALADLRGHDRRAGKTKAPRERHDVHPGVGPAQGLPIEITKARRAG